MIVEVAEVSKEEWKRKTSSTHCNLKNVCWMEFRLVQYFFFFAIYLFRKTHQLTLQRSNIKCMNGEVNHETQRMNFVILGGLPLRCAF